MSNAKKTKLGREYNPVCGYRALKFIEFLFPKDVVGKEIVRVGNKGDGGYSMLDDFANVHAAYSFGVGRDWSWDLDLASRGIDVLMFDPTIKAPQLNNLRLKYYDVGISAVDNAKRKMKTLENALSLDDNLSKTNMIFKMDIEGGEFNILHNISQQTLERFSQILIEFHHLGNVLTSEKKFNKGLTILRNLNRTHQLIWIHGCNFAENMVFGGVPFPNVFEVSYVKRIEGIKFTQQKKKKRVDERSGRSAGEVIMWWLEGGKDMDIEGLVGYYKQLAGQKISAKKQKGRNGNNLYRRKVK